MKKRTLRKRICVFAILCVLSMTIVAEPTFAATITEQRATACTHMDKMSQSKWTISKPLTFTYNASGSTTTLNAGSYVGVPYTQVAREHSYLAKDTIVLAFDNGVTLHGTDCSSSVDFAWRKGTNKAGDFLKTNKGKIELYRTKHMFNDGLVNKSPNGEQDFLMLVGKYGNYYSNRVNAETTTEMVAELKKSTNYPDGGDIYSKIYAAMKKGDALIKREYSNSGTLLGHVRLVTDVQVKYNADGSVNPNTSYVNCIEQAGFRSGNPNWKTSWMPNSEDGTKYNGKYSFAQLAGDDTSYNLSGKLISAHYLPIQLKVWNE